MNIPAARWYSVIERRRSRRRFRPEPLEANLLSQIVATCTEFKPFSNARAVLETEAPDTVFKLVKALRKPFSTRPTYVEPSVLPDERLRALISKALGEVGLT